MNVRELIKLLEACPQDALIVKPHNKNFGLDEVTRINSQPILFNINFGSDYSGSHEAYDAYERNEVDYMEDGVILLSEIDERYMTPMDRAEIKAKMAVLPNKLTPESTPT